MGAFAGLSPASLVLVILVFGLVIAYGVWRTGETWANLRQPMVSREARVLNKRICEEHGTGWEPATTYLVTFLLDNGEPVEYPVPEATYKHLSAGQCGRLSTRGVWYRGFRPLADA
jgi:hypothetical protein